MLYNRVLQSDPRATGLLLNQVDNRTGDYLRELSALYPHMKNVPVIGLTGQPGAGKSTLTTALIKYYREEYDYRIGVIAIDPSSPFTQGAILGDRVRMKRFFDDEKVFIRSVATRGALGGVSRSTGDMITVLDGYGCDLIIIETVGVGQDEVDVFHIADVTLVVLIPNAGDQIQILKAGLMEIADIFVVNKADLPEKERLVGDLLQMSRFTPNQIRPIVETIATKNQGVEELVTHINKQLKKENQVEKRQKRLLSMIIEDMLRSHVQHALEQQPIRIKNANPYQLANNIFASIIKESL